MHVKKNESIIFDIFSTVFAANSKKVMKVEEDQNTDILIMYRL